MAKIQTAALAVAGAGKRLSVVFALATVTVLSAGCAGNPWWLPAAHRITIQQGNLVNEDRLDEVKSGMPREQVLTKLGSPVADSPFHSDRWDYVFTQGPAGTPIPARRVTIFFKDELVARVEDNSETVSGERPPHRRWWEFFSPNRSSS